MMQRVILFVMALPCLFFLHAQSSGATAEEALPNASNQNSTTIGGYGNAVYRRDFNDKTATANLDRMVLFVGHNFGSISFFSELEVEDAKVSGGEDGGEVAFEQAYLKFDLNKNYYLTAGLFIPRLGILNENHLPNNFNGNERTQVETWIIPSTWREIGIGLYGTLSSLPLNFSVALVNGLNSQNFEHGSGIREGRSEGRDAGANNLAVTGSVQYFLNSFKFQLSGYYGGTVPWNPKKADSLKLQSGLFGSPVALGEADVQYEANGFHVNALGTFVSISKASEINRAYANNTPSGLFGFYLETGYDLLHSSSMQNEKQLIAFARYEKLDMNATIPGNGIIDGTLQQDHFIFGLSYLPLKNIVIKTDLRFLHTGEENPALTINPDPNAPAYKTDNMYFTLGIGFSF